MGALSAPNLELARTKPQSTELSLSVFQPRTVLSATVNGTVVAGSITIPFTTSSGSYLAVEAGMTLLVGTSAGARDVGKLRVRSLTSGNIVVAENSGITWTGKYLTVLRHFEVWPVYPRIIPDPSNDENVIFYKDYDIAYTNQNSILGTFVCAGTHKAGFVGDTFYYSSSGTTNLVSSALTYDWAFEGGSVTGSTSATPGYVAYNTPGHYVTRLIVTAANGAVDTTYRYVSIYNKAPSTTNLPIQKWSIDALSGSRGEGGFTTSIKIVNETPPQVYDGDVIVLWSEDWYGNTKQSLGGNSENNSKIFFVGHIQNGSIRYNYKTSELTFQLSSITDTMKSMEGFGISVESKASPSRWFELLDLDARRAIYHYFRWHSTVLSLADFQFIGSDRKTQFFDSDRESLFDAVDNYMRTALVGDLVADRQGKLWAEVGAVAYTNPTGSFPPIQLIDKRDWIGEPSIQQRLVPEKSFIEMGGVAYSGSTTGTYSAFISQAPGATPGYRGSTENTQGLTLESQDQLNTLSGNVFANANSKYPSIDLSLSGNYRQFDIAPLNTVDVNIASDDTNLGVNIHAPYLIDSMAWSYSSQNKLMLPNMGLVSLVNSRADGETITIPDIPDGGGFSDFGGGFSNFSPGNIPAFLPPLISELSVLKYWQATSAVVPRLSGSTVIYFGTAYGFPVSYTTKFTNDTSLISINASGYPSVNKAGFYLIHCHFYIDQSTSFTEMAVGMSISSQVFMNNYNRVLLPIPGLSTESLTYAFKSLSAYLSVGDYIVPFASYTKTITQDDGISLLFDIVKLG